MAINNMKALKVFEKFTEDSDPIHDLRIGSINFEEKAKETIRNDEKPMGHSEWINYLYSLKGKTITGIFKNHSKIAIKIRTFESYREGRLINFFDDANVKYVIDENERYYIH